MIPIQRSRPQQIAAIVVAALLVAIGFLPLFGGPGYELGLAAGLIVPSAAAIAAAIDVARNGRNVPPLACVGRGMATGVALFAIAYLTSLLHGLRVGFCDLAGGTRDVALTAGFGALLGGTWGAIVGELAARARRLRLACTLLAIAAPIGGIVISVIRFVTSPMIFAFDPFFGYFSGTLYDTVIDAGTALLSYRAGSACTLVGAALVASVLTRDDRGRVRVAPLRGDAGRITRAALGACALAASLGVTLAGAKLGHWQTAATIARELGGRRVGARCDLVYPDGERPDQVALLMRDCEEELRQVESVLGARGPARVTAFFFRDAGEKKRLMGAESTYIAKPWREEVYLQLHAYPHPVLGHELAHVVAGSFGRGPFRVAGALGGLWPNPGLIEGTAVAASPDDDELTDGQWAHAMMDLGILPPMRRVFSIGFLGESSAKSYTLAGAFVRWLIDTRGAEALRRWYGGEDVERITGEPWAKLDEAFRAHLAREPLPPEAMAFAKAKFDRPSVFGRRCPHVVDALRREADGCRDALQVDRAVSLYDDVLARDPHDAAARFGLGITNGRYGDEARGRSALAALASDARTPRTWRDRAAEAIADLDLVNGKWEDARAQYEALAAKELDEDVGRTLDVKAYAAPIPEGRAALAALLVGAPGRPIDAWEGAARLGAWAAASHDPVAEYVLGKNLAQHEWWREAAEHLDVALAAPAPTRRIGRELLRMRAVCACAIGDDAAVARVQAALRGSPDRPSPFEGSSGGRRAALERLIARCASSAAAPATPPAP